MIKVFFDMEFTGLYQNTTPISIGCVSEHGDTFYGEFGDFNHLQVDDWIKENVISKLLFHEKLSRGWCNCSTHVGNTFITECYGNRKFIADCLEDWFNNCNSQIEIWSDCLAYDWVLFCELWGGAMKTPDKIYYIPFDICTLFKIKGIDPDIDRESFVGETVVNKHNALWDAKIIKECYDKLIKL